jgi:two-component system, OmpR family, response regulator BaeR
MTQKQRILIIENDKKIIEILSHHLIQAGFNVSVLRRGDTVISEVRYNPPDLIILDIVLPGKDGMTVCRELRVFSMVPIIMLSGKAEEVDPVLGLELGADDYICKPFSPRELVARAKTILRRTHAEPTEEILVAGPITINPENHSAIIEGKNLQLTPSEFELLRLMASCPDDVFTRDNLFPNLKGHKFRSSKRIIDSHIKSLRKKINNVTSGKALIRTVYGMGYSLRIS